MGPFSRIKRTAIFFVTMLMSIFICGWVLAYDFTGWDQGVLGYGYALSDAQSEEKPIILYFHQNSCEWCEKMESKYLAAYEVEDFFMDIPKVEINPDREDNEESLCKTYKVSNYPAFFVFVPAFKGKPERIHPFSEKGGMSTEDFLSLIRDFIVNQYQTKATKAYGQKAYEKASKYYDMAIKYDPQDAYGYYGRAVVNHGRFADEKDTELLTKAEEDYLKALEIDSKHKGSRQGLKKLRMYKQEMGIE